MITLTFPTEEEFRRFLARPGSFSLSDLARWYSNAPSQPAPVPSPLMRPRYQSPMLLAMLRFVQGRKRHVKAHDIVSHVVARSRRRGPKAKAAAYRYLKRLCDQGVLARVRPGVYRWASSP